LGTIISVVNHKGGTSKTSTTANVSHALANKGFSVLCVDLDPQSNLSKIMVAGHKYGGSVEAIPRTLYDVLANGLPVKEAVHRTHYDDLSCLPNTTATNVLEMDLHGDRFAESTVFLQKHLRPWAKSAFDFVILDCQPSLNVFVHMAMNASDLVIIPVEAGSQFSLDGVPAAIKLIGAIGATTNPELGFLRLLINKVDLRTSISRSAVDEIHDRYGDDLVFATTIPISTEIQKAEAACSTVLRQAPRSTAAKKYRALAEEICRLLGVSPPAKESK